MAELTFNVSGKERGKSFTLGEIPDNVWQAFQESARRKIPEKGDRAWVSVIANFIASMVSSKTDTFIMTDIPNQAINNLETLCKDVGVDKETFLVRMFESAMKNQMGMIVFPDKPDNRYSLVMMGISPQTISKMDAQIKEKGGQGILGFLGALFEKAEEGKVFFTMPHEVSKT